MAKKPILQKPIDAVLSKPNEDSKALKRVKFYGKSDGIYLSNAQLKKIIDANKNANGIWFAIGYSDKSLKNTVEVLPVKRVSDKMSIVNNGYFSVDSNVDFYLDNDRDARFSDITIVISPAAGPTIPSQRTPPPSPE
jgi:hypothetical protein